MSVQKTLVNSTLLKKNVCRTLLRQFLAHTPVYIRHVLQSGKYNYCSFRGTGRGPKYTCKIISVKAIDYSIGWYAPNVKARYSAFTSSPKYHSDCNIAANIFLSSSPILYNIQHMPICHANKLWGWVEICWIPEATFSGWITLVKPLWHWFSKLVSENENKVRSQFRIRHHCLR